MPQSLFLRSLNFLAFRMNLISNGKAVSISYRKRGPQHCALNPYNGDFYFECTSYAKAYQLDRNVHNFFVCYVFRIGSRYISLMLNMIFMDSLQNESPNRSVLL